jgi:hypothetical protein
MTNYTGPDKIVGQLFSTVGPQILYWENVKSLDVQRLVNSIVLKIEDEKQEYIGFGRESWKDSEISATIFLYQTNPQILTDEDTLEGYLQTIHTIVNQYDNSSQTDTVVGNPLVWVRITDEKRMEDVRGIILYDITLEVRIYLVGNP